MALLDTGELTLKHYFLELRIRISYELFINERSNYFTGNVCHEKQED